VLDFGPGTNFQDSDALIRKNLKYAGFDEVMLEETKNWNSG